MNIVRFEFRQLVRSTALWWVAMAGLIAVYVSVYPTFAEDAASMKQLFDAMPPAMHAALGVNVAILGSFLGFLSNIFTIMLLVAAIHGAFLGITLLGREQRSVTTEFLFTKPVSRTKLFAAKLLVGTVIVILTMVWVGSVIVGMGQLVGAGEIDPGRFMMIVSVFGVVEAWFFAAGMMWVTLVRRHKAIAPAAMTVAFGFFLLGVVGAMIDKEVVRWIVPMQYVDLASVVQTGAYDSLQLVVGLIVLVGFVTISYLICCRRDVESAA